jgi:hypothetical protein
VRLTASLLKPGSRVTVVQIELQKPILGEAANQTCAIGIITMSNISLESGLSLPIDPSIPKEDIPDRERECEQWTLESDHAKEGSISILL